MTLRAVNLTKKYGKQKVLVDISFNLEAQSITALVGSNGSGKTTLLKLLSGFVRTYKKSEVFFNGKKLPNGNQSIRTQEGMAYMSQTPTSVPFLSLAQNFALTDKDLTQEMTDRILTDVRLIDKKHSKSANLSYGEKRKLEFALTMSKVNKYFLLDEPFSGLEPKVIHSLLLLIKSLNSNGAGFLIADHRLDELLKIADSFLFLHKGSAMMFENKEKFLSNPIVRETYLGDWQPNQ